MGDAIAGSFTRKPRMPHLSCDGLLWTKSDMTSQFSKDAVDEATAEFSSLPPISEVDTNCECCGMCEVYTAEYIDRVRARYLGKWICGLCTEAVKEEMDRHGGVVRGEEALRSHMIECARFKNISAALYQAVAMRQIMKMGTLRAKYLSPRDKETGQLQRKSVINACYYQGA